jgi:hypothetical protein
MREIRRRTRVVGAFPDGQSCLNLAAARLRYIAGTAWSAKCYMNMRQRSLTRAVNAIARESPQVDGVRVCDSRLSTRFPPRNFSGQEKWIFNPSKIAEAARLARQAAPQAATRAEWATCASRQSPETESKRNPILLPTAILVRPARLLRGRRWASALVARECAVLG